MNKQKLPNTFSVSIIYKRYNVYSVPSKLISILILSNLSSFDNAHLNEVLLSRSSAYTRDAFVKVCESM